MAKGHRCKRVTMKPSRCISRYGARSIRRLSIQNMCRDQRDVRNDGGKTNKTKLAGCTRSKRQQKKHLPLREECAPCCLLRGISPSSKERNVVERMSYGDQPGRGAREATTFLRKNRKGICEVNRASPDTSDSVVQDGHGSSTRDL